ncbi:hypothetical protein STEG23_013549 [Scotinomys teguina]
MSSVSYHCLFSGPLDTKTGWSKSPVVTYGLKAIIMDTVLTVILLDRCMYVKNVLFDSVPIASFIGKTAFS